MNEIYQYAVSIPFDVTTSTYIGDVSISREANIQVVYISPDGRRMYVTGHESGDTILQYTLTTPFLVSSASYVGYLVTPKCDYTFTFSEDGTNLYLCVQGNQSTLSRYSLSTAWELNSTLTLLDTLSGSFAQVNFNNTGTILYSFQYPNVSIYRLSTAWVLSSARLFNTVSIVGIPAEKYYMYHSEDAIFLSGGVNNKYIYKYIVLNTHKISGITQINNIPVQTIVRLYNTSTNLLIDEVNSDVDGNFLFYLNNNNIVRVVALSPDSQYNDMCYKVTPVAI